MATKLDSHSCTQPKFILSIPNIYMMLFPQSRVPGMWEGKGSGNYPSAFEIAFVIAFVIVFNQSITMGAL
jgi:hypothetical protein